MALYDTLAALPLQVENYSLEGRSRTIGSADSMFVRKTTTFSLRGAGEEGKGEDVVYSSELQQAQLDAGPALQLSGEWTIDSFSQHLATLDLFFGEEIDQPAYTAYRRWALESAAVDLALRQAGRSLADLFAITPGPIEFVVSLRVGDPPSLAPITDRLAAYPGTRFKLDSTPSWDAGFIAALADTGAVESVDFKGTYRGTTVDVPTDAALYERVARLLPEARLEDPDLTDPRAAAALEPFRDRIAWDAPIHGVSDLEALPFAPRTINVKPSRIGSWSELLRTYEWCAERGIATYGGGQSELGVGRGQCQYLASLFHPAAPNDLAPAGYDWVDFPKTGLAPAPLAPDLEPVGFRCRF